LQIVLFLGCLLAIVPLDFTKGLEIVSINSFIQFYINVPKYLKEFVEGQLYAQYPNVEISEAEEYVRTPSEKQAIGAEILTRYMDYKDRESCILFGDGGGAAIVSARGNDEQSGIYSTHMYADGSLGDMLMITAGKGNKNTIFHDPGEEYRHIIMKGRELFKHASRTMSDVGLVSAFRPGPAMVSPFANPPTILTYFLTIL